MEDGFLCSGELLGLGSGSGEFEIHGHPVRDTP
jgi:hypothetical protein